MNIKKNKKMSWVIFFSLIVAVLVFFNVSGVLSLASSNISTAPKIQSLDSASEENEPEEFESFTTSPSDCFYIADGALVELTKKGKEQTTLTVPTNITSITFDAFGSTDRLETLVMYDNVKTLELACFQDSSIKRIKLSNSITTIPPSTFLRCRQLEEVILPEALVSIGRYAFSGCTKLRKIVIPKSVRHIEACAFESWIRLDDFEIINHSPVLFNWWVQNHQYNGKCLYEMQDINLADYRNSDNEEFTIISDGAFAGKENGVDYLQNIKLETININNKVTAIFDEAFMGCDNLRAVTIPESVEYLGSDMFKGCRALKTQGMTSYSRVLFDWWCNNHDYVDQNDPANKSTNPTVISSYSVNLDPDRFTNSNGKKFNRIGCGAFKNCNYITSVKLSDEIKSIGNYAFNSCKQLKKINIPANITVIAKGTFGRCEELEEVEVHDAITVFEERAFEFCSKLTNLNFPKSLEKIGLSCFQFTNLENVTLPENLKIIEDNVFNECKFLEKINIPASITAFGQDVFRLCPLLRNVQNESIFLFDWWVSTHRYAYKKTISGKKEITEADASLFVNSLNQPLQAFSPHAFEKCDNLEKIVIPISFKKIARQTFFYCKNLKYVEIMHPISAIGEGAFSNCDAIEEIKVFSIKVQDLIIRHSRHIKPDIVTVDNYYKVSGNVLSSVSYDAKQQRKLFIPYNVTKIGDSVFADSPNLTEITFPSGLREIGIFAFQNCPFLRTVIFPADSELEKIDRCAFQNCPSLESITLPKTVKYIAQDAFDGCDLLEVVNNSRILFDWWVKNHYYKNWTLAQNNLIVLERFENSAKESFQCIGEGAFGGQSNLEKIILPGTIKEIHQEAFRDCTNLNFILIYDGLEKIGPSAFVNCVALREMLLPDTLKEIEEAAFAYCANLRRVKFPQYLKVIGNSAFHYCSGLRVLEMPEAIDRIEANAFAECINLYDVEFPDHLEYIGDRAFENCTSLRTLNIPEGVTFGEAPFWGCSPKLRYYVKTEATKKLLLDSQSGIKEEQIFIE